MHTVLGLHLNEQRHFLNRFWKFFKQQAFSTITYNTVVRKKYDTLTLFDTFLLFLTNVDNLSLKVFSMRPTKDYFSCFLNFFKAKAHSQTGRDLFSLFIKL